ncbi:hypothetical protein [Metamycoplasma buccale]|uniref:hypothetical protein n=1 Tax=Metamycoplasma buccale TaxID=55602 RepID=UPI00398F6F79
MIEITPWLEYFSGNKKIYKELKKIKNKGILPSDFTSPLFLLKNKFIAKNGLGHNKFNEITLHAIAQSYVNLLQKSIGDLQNQYILLASDGFDNEYEKYLDYLQDVFNAYRIKVLRFKDSLPVTKSFLLYVINKTKNINTTIYISKYSVLKSLTSVEFINDKGANFLSNEIQNIYNMMQEIDPFSCHIFYDDYFKLDSERLLSEYADEILKANHNEGGNKLLKIGIVTDNTSNAFVKKILGRNDISYTLINKTIKKEKPNKIYLPLWKNQKFDYLLKFSYDHKKVFLYAKKSNSLCFGYSLVDISNLVAVYLNFLNTTQSTNENFSSSNLIISSKASKEYLIDAVAQKFALQSKTEIILDFNEIVNLPNVLYFNEINEFYLSSNIKYCDEMLPVSTIVDMLNYYKTQNLNFAELYKNLTNNLQKFDLNTFEINVEKYNKINTFENEIIKLKRISLFEISNIENLQQFELEKEKYISKIHFNEYEWLLIKYSKETKKLIFFVHEPSSNKQLIFKKLKKHFCKNIFLYFLDEKNNESIESNEEQLENENS